MKLRVLTRYEVPGYEDVMYFHNRFITDSSGPFNFKNLAKRFFFVVKCKNYARGRARTHNLAITIAVYTVLFYSVRLGLRYFPNFYFRYLRK